MKFDSESNNSAFTTDDLYSTHEDFRSQSLKNIFKLKKNKKLVIKAKLYRDLKIFLLMIYSISYLVFVLPETLIKIYNYKHTITVSLNYSKSHMSSVVLLSVFYQLKLIYYSSNFLAYLTLVTLTTKKKQIMRRFKRWV